MVQKAHETQQINNLKNEGFLPGKAKPIKETTYEGRTYTVRQEFVKTHDNSDGWRAQKRKNIVLLFIFTLGLAGIAYILSSKMRTTFKNRWAGKEVVQRDLTDVFAKSINQIFSNSSNNFNNTHAGNQGSATNTNTEKKNPQKQKSTEEADPAKKEHKNKFNNVLKGLKKDSTKKENAQKLAEGQAEPKQDQNKDQAKKDLNPVFAKIKKETVGPKSESEVAPEKKEESKVASKEESGHSSDEEVEEKKETVGPKSESEVASEKKEEPSNSTQTLSSDETSE